ncbi:26S proteasome regulatory subunit [Komagataella phaffii CBS 7435]|uniref:Essential, non-ATPase regulatory subunit of the 26S proteasome n=2 Tax=Komagataella phaffii TaxID=460519 RepID=C4R4L9_KOMPG|nr:Essential, non-ATPase regulatory subunit of the 26S proteasome [Komagataella phaffii GS115]AOA63443.1 GQ67_03528T0 [Komagataella phaffii]CAH2449733.1 26S proteasome regulatory subunit [Komagataella phaffii CBS 7435]AOA68216.1 GQ68_03498T0 [Komagataella phaffii GS115]CAY70505.1 Essential, non-ATPase regulatory subunit of the 26S proteasome [Komagataella phaffii GS115]CCA39706.1 26S proteasome regulatory subunit [Komagataella phaffii CBS 7435]
MATYASGIPKIPDFDVSKLSFLAQIADGDGDAALVDKVIQGVETNEMAPYYHYLYHQIALPGLEWDQGLYDKLVLQNEKKVEELTNKIKVVDEDDEGEVENAECWAELGNYYAQIGDKNKAIETLGKATDLAPSIGAKIDIKLTLSRIGFFYDDKQFTKKYLDEANALIEKGGDWERKNRYKVYTGIHDLSMRKFKEASDLLIGALPTFTSTELLTYEDLALYALIAGVISLDRKNLKKQLIDSPEILSIESHSSLFKPIFSLLKALYDCKYDSFFKHLLETNDQILTKNVNLAPHANYYLRELRVKAYSQLLESYKSLSLKSMSEEFGVSIEFLDHDLCQFIPNKQLNCVIDRVNGIVETNRPDNKNNQYNLLIKSGDALLTKLQKYGATVRLSGTEKAN